MFIGQVMSVSDVTDLCVRGTAAREYQRLVHVKWV